MSMGVHCKICDTDHDNASWRSLGMVCAKCNKHTGNHNQGHFTKVCRKVVGEPTERLREWHFCCPDVEHQVLPELQDLGRTE